MIRKTVTTTEEYDANGKLKTKIVEEVTEEDNGYIYPQKYSDYPTWPNTPIQYKFPTEITCDTAASNMTIDEFKAHLKGATTDV